jgi:hypothetical protein
MANRIMVGNMSFDTQEQSLGQAMGQFGQVTDVKVSRHAAAPWRGVDHRVLETVAAARYGVGRRTLVPGGGL